MQIEDKLIELAAGMVATVEIKTGQRDRGWRSQSGVRWMLSMRVGKLHESGASTRVRGRLHIAHRTVIELPQFRQSERLRGANSFSLRAGGNVNA